MAVRLENPYWGCSICGEVFDNYEEAVAHEKAEHKCLTCKYIAYLENGAAKCTQSGVCKWPEHSLYKERTNG